LLLSVQPTLPGSEPTLNEGRRYRRFKVKSEAWLEIDILASFRRGGGHAISARS
jgi:hypothetical protein